MNKLTTRPAHITDKDWLWSLYVITLQKFIEQTWGWDEDFQHATFSSHLHPEKFTIVMLDKQDVGAYLINEFTDHFWLEMLLVTPERQQHGIGRFIIEKLQSHAQKQGKPLRLNVLKVNPVRGFYQTLGFQQYNEDEFFYQMSWQA